ncbi:MAG TPA: hypothetical protein VGV38_13610 [Pyrinomonadaceae bacterium]|nr:hypothetical protein [Pyrinomonadaceae bacterium]
MNNISRPEDLVSTTEARKLLGVSTVKMTQLIKSGTFIVYSDLLDRRVKLISRAEVEALKTRSVKAA